MHWTQNVSVCSANCIGKSLRRFQQITRCDYQLHHVCLPVFRLSAWKNSAGTRRIFMKFYIWLYFENLSRKLQFHRNLLRRPGILHEGLCTVGQCVAHFFLEWEMFQTKVVEKIQTHILCSVTFFFRKSCRLWDTVEKYCTAGQATDDNMAHSLCILHN